MATLASTAQRAPVVAVSAANGRYECDRGKGSWPSKAAAQRALEVIRKRGHRREDGVKPCRVYWCGPTVEHPDYGGCRRWHLTSVPE